MNGINVTITDMMNCRDRRVSIQNELISKYDKPVLSFCMNIPGPVKTNELIRKAFDSGKAELLKALSAHNITILHTEEFHEPSGDELIMALDAPAEDIKTLATEIEESHPLGRLFDMDVIGTDGMKLSAAPTVNASSADARHRNVRGHGSIPWRNCRQRLRNY